MAGTGPQGGFRRRDKGQHRVGRPGFDHADGLETVRGLDHDRLRGCWSGQPAGTSPAPSRPVQPGSVSLLGKTGIVVTPPLRGSDTLGLRKARGAFFTPARIARYIADWAVRTPSDQILEPSCGEAAFLLAPADRLRTLGPGLRAGNGLHGVDFHEGSAEQAHALLRTSGADAEITVSDFFLLDPALRYDTMNR